MKKIVVPTTLNVILQITCLFKVHNDIFCRKNTHLKINMLAKS